MPVVCNYAQHPSPLLRREPSSQKDPRRASPCRRCSWRSVCFPRCPGTPDTRTAPQFPTLERSSNNYHQTRLLVQFHDVLRVSEVVSVAVGNQDEIHVQSGVAVSLRELGVTSMQDPYQRIRCEGIDQNARSLRLNEEARVSQPNDLRHIFVPFRIVEKTVTRFHVSPFYAYPSFLRMSTPTLKVQDPPKPSTPKKEVRTCDKVKAKLMAFHLPIILLFAIGIGIFFPKPGAPRFLSFN